MRHDIFFSLMTLASGSGLFINFNDFSNIKPQFVIMPNSYLRNLDSFLCDSFRSGDPECWTCLCIKIRDGHTILILYTIIYTLYLICLVCKHVLNILITLYQSCINVPLYITL